MNILHIYFAIRKSRNRNTIILVGGSDDWTLKFVGIVEIESGRTEIGREDGQKDTPLQYSFSFDNF